MMVPPPGGASLAGPALAGAKPLAKPKPAFGKKPGKPQQGKKPGNWPWWKPWYPHAGYWSDWAPAWWIGWGVVNADMTYVDALPYVVVWIDRCSPEWRRRLPLGPRSCRPSTTARPSSCGYTCGNLAEMEDVPGTPAYGAVETQLEPEARRRLGRSRRRVRTDVRRARSAAGSPRSHARWLPSLAP